MSNLKFTFRVLGKDGYKSFPDHTRMLRKLGFKRTYFSRAGGCSTAIYKKELSDRVIDVQLWGDGKHRATHWVRGGQNTHPTDFVTIEQMVDAIEHESTRRDNYRLNLGKGGDND